MGLIKKAMYSASSVLSDQFKDYFYCDSLPNNVLVRKGTSKRKNDNIISNGSIIAVADGQCMIIVDQGQVVELCANPGEYVYDISSESSLFFGDLDDNIDEMYKTIERRFSFGGQSAREQRVYYINTKECVGNKYGTPSPIPFRVVDENINLDMDISIRCFGEYSYRITNPILFYTNVCGNIEQDYTRDRIDAQLKSELLTALQPAFAKISNMGIRYSALPGHTMELAEALNSVLSKKWSELRGVEIVSFGINSIKASQEDEETIKQLQKSATFKNASMANAQMMNSQAEAIKEASKNPNGAGMAFMAMNMAQNAYVNQNQDTTDSWTCSCGQLNTKGKFCMNCGKPKPETKGWTCPNCHTLNLGKFCMECGTKKPQGALQYRCDKCGWTPADPTNPPKFCPECGDSFGDEDIVK